MFLNDHEIKAIPELITPFSSDQVKYNHGLKVISYGLSSFGYDVRLDNQFLMPSFDINANPIIDPKQMQDMDYIKIKTDSILIPPGGFVLGQTIEYFKIPRNIVALVIGKSTYARCAVNVNTTPLEPEWEGTITIEISNMNIKPVKIYAGEGIAQVLFALNPNGCYTSYKDRNGKYQKQTSVTIPKV